MPETFIQLPFPPSVNALYANMPGKGRVKSKKYKIWYEAAGWKLREQRPTRFKKLVHILITFGPKPGPQRKWDMSNHVKAVEDLLVSHGIIVDDCSKIIKRLTLTQEPDQDGILVHIFNAREAPK